MARVRLLLTVFEVITTFLIAVKSVEVVADTASENLARNMNASQSSTAGHYGAALAVDGDYNSSFSGGSCTHTASADIHPWWVVDLRQTAVVKEVVIYNRQDCCAERLHDFYIEILQSGGHPTPSLCHHQIPALGKSAAFLCNPPLKGRYVKIRKDNVRDSKDILTLCEVEVNGDIITTAAPPASTTTDAGLTMGELFESEGQESSTLVKLHCTTMTEKAADFIVLNSLSSRKSTMESKDDTVKFENVGYSQSKDKQGYDNMVFSMEENTI
ncbi:fucolectin-1-like [Gigantopelta aegis]|uniref:fucolectin-1-like n=1 Tax=Gigantopelta aegis TaxID=1735272 RepID=UPI001B889F0C|nr:fucolectin-1-like [Gigantopelta aegis]